MYTWSLVYEELLYTLVTHIHMPGISNCNSIRILKNLEIKQFFTSIRVIELERVVFEDKMLVRKNILIILII